MIRVTLPSQQHVPLPEARRLALVVPKRLTTDLLFFYPLIDYLKGGLVSPFFIAEYLFWRVHFNHWKGDGYTFNETYYLFAAHFCLSWVAGL
jgi:hypothetical protein